jgi:hypothetical protein
VLGNAQEKQRAQREGQPGECACDSAQHEPVHAAVRLGLPSVDSPASRRVVTRSFTLF